MLSPNGVLQISYDSLHINTDSVATSVVIIVCLVHAEYGVEGDGVGGRNDHAGVVREPPLRQCGQHYKDLDHVGGESDGDGVIWVQRVADVDADAGGVGVVAVCVVSQAEHVEHVVLLIRVVGNDLELVWEGQRDNVLRLHNE